jgi:hypothetical protein
MLYSFVLQFIPDRKEAEDLLVNIFQTLTTRLQEACQSPLSVYCWMQIEARKIILDHTQCQTDRPDNGQEEQTGTGEELTGLLEADIRQFPSSYLTLLRRATEEQQWVFRELFLHGRQKEELALQLSQDGAYIDRVLRESLGIIRDHL